MEVQLVDFSGTWAWESSHFGRKMCLLGLILPLNKGAACQHVEIRLREKIQASDSASCHQLVGVLLGLILVIASSGQLYLCDQSVDRMCPAAAPACWWVQIAGWIIWHWPQKAEITSLKEKHFHGHPCGLLGNDGIHNPACEGSCIFKARRCNQADASGVRPLPG